MKNYIIDAPMEVSKAAIRTVTSGGRLAKGLESLTRRVQPDYVRPEVLAQQAILRQFEGRFGVASDLMNLRGSKRKLEDRVKRTAFKLVNEGIVSQDTAVELRPILPEDALCSTDINARRESAIFLLEHTLTDDYDITTVPNSYPIMPSKTKEKAVDITETWGAISAELDGLTHQIPGVPQKQLAMVAIASSGYAERIFEGQTIIPGQHQDHTDELWVLRHVGRQPQENVMLGV